jgi:predicted short-subunit dehydrogenase-like oxidoreductase (DUF2520 family)
MSERGSGRARLTIIGCGRIGKACGLLFSKAGLARVHEVLNRSLASSQAAVEFLGQGSAVSEIRHLTPADVFLLAAPDDALAPIAQALSTTSALHTGALVFHTSGALSAEILSPVKNKGARVASAHPVKSFADPRAAAESFNGTWCGLEGDAAACDFLVQWLRQVGARTFPIRSEAKLLYHAGTVFASNYLPALVDSALRCFELAGIAGEPAMEVLLPLLYGTVENITQLGPENALTGPISRGDLDLVSRQHRALDAADREIARLYFELGRATARLAAARGSLSPHARAQMERVFGRSL